MKNWIKTNHLDAWQFVPRFRRAIRGAFCRGLVQEKGRSVKQRSRKTNGLTGVLIGGKP